MNQTYDYRVASLQSHHIPTHTCTHWLNNHFQREHALTICGVYNGEELVQHFCIFVWLNVSQTLATKYTDHISTFHRQPLADS